MSRQVKEMLVGGLVFVVFVLAIVFSYSARGVAEKATSTGYEISATFNRVDGLTVGDEVRLGGIPVGTVSGQDLDENFRAVVSMWIGSGIKLPRDTSVAILTDGLFGGKHLELEPGGDEMFLADGDRIEFAQDAVIVGDLLDLVIAQGRARLATQEEEAEAGAQ